MKVQGEDPATPGCQKETGWGFTPAILNRGCVKPWLALLKTRERKLIPQYRDIKQSNTHRDGGEQTTWIKQSLPQRCVCVGCQLNSDQALRLPCLKGQVSYAVTFRWQEASEFLCTKTPLFWRELSNQKNRPKPPEMLFRRATNVTYSKLRGWRRKNKIFKPCFARFSLIYWWIDSN